METQVLISKEDGPGQMTQVLAVMADVVAQYGADHVYTRRVYTDPDGCTATACYYINEEGTGPDCLIGQVAWRFGWTVGDLADVENTGPEFGGQRFDEFHTDVAKVLGAAQGPQDSGRPWGECLNRARAHARDLGYDV